jgi:aryl-alcohol dehydrogenase-like predicted oxidoreductase
MLHAAGERGWSRFVTMQNHYNLLYREEEREMNPLCRSEGVGLIPWSPLARGVLAGSRQRNSVRARTDTYADKLYGARLAESDQRVVGAVAKVAESRGVPPAQIALAWLLSHPEVVAPIVGASKPHHLDDAVAALEIKLTAEEIQALEEPYVPHPIAGHG